MRAGTPSLRRLPADLRRERSVSELEVYEDIGAACNLSFYRIRLRTGAPQGLAPDFGVTFVAGVKMANGRDANGPWRDGMAGQIGLTARTRDLLGAAAIVITAFVVSLWLFRLFWHRDALADLTQQPGGWMGAMAIVACTAVVHEILHGLAWCLVARVPWRSISVRASWRVMGFVAGPDVPLPATAFRVGVAAPGLILGAIPIAAGLSAGLGLLVLWGLFALLECFSDAALLLAIHTVPAGALVVGHEEKLGCRVVLGTTDARRS